MMGSALKVLFGAFLVIWSVLGLLLIIGAFTVSARLEDIRADIQELNQRQSSTEVGAAPSDGTTEAQEPVACVRDQLGLARTLALLKGEDATVDEQVVLDACNFSTESETAPPPAAPDPVPSAPVEPEIVEPDTSEQFLFPEEDSFAPEEPFAPLVVPEPYGAEPGIAG